MALCYVMRILFCIAFLPHILPAEIKSLQCPDGTKCPFGTFCCENTNLGQDEVSSYKCCDLPENMRRNKKLVPGMCASSQRNNSAPTLSSGLDGIVPQALSECPGTMCTYDTCCYHEDAVCCPNLSNCCPSGFICCGEEYATVNWCCTESQRCYENGYCLAGATALTPPITTFVSLLLLVTLLLKIHT